MKVFSNLTSALVVFLVALPLCIGIAAASGLSPDKGLIAGAIGGIIVGILGGAPLQVSGPANGLIPVIAELGASHGVVILGAAVMVAGILQALAGFLRLGVFFRAICPSVVYGLMAGFGIVIMGSQLVISLGGAPGASVLVNAGLVVDQVKLVLAVPTVRDALLVATVSLVTILGWNRFSKVVPNRIPAYLVAILAGTGAQLLFGLTSKTILIPETLSQDLSEGLASISALVSQEPSALTTILEFAVTIAIVASIETMVSTVALDKMSKGKPSNYDRELFAQGVGNFLCGLFSAPPITGVIIRSSANLQAGATSRLSTILHGVFLLVAMLALGNMLRFIPAASLSVVLVHAASRLINVNAVRALAREERRHVVTFVATTLAVTFFGVLYGVAAGLGFAALSMLRKFAHLEIKTTGSQIVLSGTATFIDLPRLLKILDRFVSDPQAKIVYDDVRYMDASTREALSAWQKQRQLIAGGQT